VKFQEAAEQDKPFRSEGFSEGWYWWFKAGTLVAGKYPEREMNVTLTRADLNADYVVRIPFLDLKSGDIVKNADGKPRQLIGNGNTGFMLICLDKEDLGESTDMGIAPGLCAVSSYMIREGYEGS
jgi:hypothetical protein